MANSTPNKNQEQYTYIYTYARGRNSYIYAFMVSNKIQIDTVVPPGNGDPNSSKDIIIGILNL